MFEPVFQPNPNGTAEDDGVILTPVLHLETMEMVQLLILEAKGFTEMAKVTFKAKGPVTPTLHGIFDPWKERRRTSIDSYW